MEVLDLESLADPVMWALPKHVLESAPSFIKRLKIALTKNRDVMFHLRNFGWWKELGAEFLCQVILCRDGGNRLRVQPLNCFIFQSMWK